MKNKTEVTGKSLGLTTIQTRLINVSEVATILNCSEREVYNKAKRGEILYHYIGCQYKFDPADVDDYILSTKLFKKPLENITQLDIDEFVKHHDERNELLNTNIINLCNRINKNRKRRRQAC